VDEKIQRYTQGDACGGEYALCRPRKDPDGELVYYEDVVALEAEVKRLRDMIVRFCEANVQAADTWKQREDIAPLFAVAEEVETPVQGKEEKK